MEEEKRKIYEKELGKELLEGLLELGKVEPIIQSIFQYNHTKELSKRVSAALLIVIDNRNKILQQIIKMTNIKI